MQQVPHVGPVLVEHRTVEAEAVLDKYDRLGCRLPTGDQACHIARGDEEHDEDDRSDHPEDDESEQDPVDEEAHHWLLPEEPFAAGIECIANAVAEQVERQRGDQQGKARQKHEPPGHSVPAERLREHVAP